MGNRITVPATELAFVDPGTKYPSPDRPNVSVLGVMQRLPLAFTGPQALLLAGGAGMRAIAQR